MRGRPQSAALPECAREGYANEDDEQPTAKKEVHSPDATSTASGSLRLRAERGDDGSGRVYLIVVRATNLGGGTAFVAGTVVVPKNMSATAESTVSAMAQGAMAYALANNGAPPAGYFVVGDGPVIGPKQ